MPYNQRDLKMKTKKRRFFDLISIFIIVSFSLFAWWPLLKLSVRDSGLIYLSKYHQEWFWRTPYFFTMYEFQATILGTIFAKVFGPKMIWYYAVELLVMMVINGLFYWLTKAITKSRWMGFAAALIFSVNYWGLWDIYTNHCYCFFLERVPNVILSLVSFGFLYQALEKSSKKSYFLAVFFYTLSVGLSHFSVLHTAPWLFFPFCWRLFNHQKKKEVIGGGIKGLIFLGITGLIVLVQRINQSGMGPKYSLVDFILHPQEYFWAEKIIRQLVYWSQYPFVLIWGNNAGSFIHQIGVVNAISTTPLVLIAYLLAAIIIYKKLPKLRPFLLTIVFAVPANFFVNAFFGQYAILDQPNPNRYLYFPTFWLSIFWAMFLGAVFFKKGKILMLIGGMILGFYYLESYALISEHFKKILPYEKPNRVVYDYLIEMTPHFKKGTLVLAPLHPPYYIFGPHEETFFNDQLGRDGEIRIMSKSNLYRAERWEDAVQDSAYVIELEYDETCQCVREERLK